MDGGGPAGRPRAGRGGEPPAPAGRASRHPPARAPAPHGGVYVDADFECLKPIDRVGSARGGVTCCLGLLDSGRVSNAVIGCVPGHRCSPEAMAGGAAANDLRACRPRGHRAAADRAAPARVRRRHAVPAERLLRDRARPGRVRVPPVGAIVEGRGGRCADDLARAERDRASPGRSCAGCRNAGLAGAGQGCCGPHPRYSDRHADRREERSVRASS